jgi:hypothetical protein
MDKPFLFSEFAIRHSAECDASSTVKHNETELVWCSRFGSYQQDRFPLYLKRDADNLARESNDITP